MTQRTRFILFGLFFALMFSYAGADSYLTLRQVLNTSARGWQAAEQGGHALIVRVNPAGPAGGSLREGDEVISLKGLQPPDAPSATETFWPVEVGYAYAITVQRDGQAQEFKLQTGAFPLYWRLVIVMGSLVIPVAFLISGLVLFLLKPHDKQARLLAVMFSTFVFDGPFVAAGLPWWVLGVLTCGGIISTIFPAIFLHFFLIFPEPSRLLKKFPRLEYYIYLPCVLVMVPVSIIISWKWIAAGNHLISPDTDYPNLYAIWNIVYVLYAVCGLSSLIYNYRKSSSHSKRRVRVVLAGFIAGAMPLMLWNVVFMFADPGIVSAKVFHMLLLFVWSALLLLPLSFAYAIVRHQVIPVSLIIRRSVRYLLVARGFILIEVLVAFEVLNLLLTGNHAVMIQHMNSRAMILIEVAASALLIGLVGMIHRRVMPIINRRFFREPYDAQRVLSELGRAIVSVTSIEPLLKLTATKIQDALHAENVNVFLRDDKTGDFVRIISLTHSGKLNIEASDATQTDALRLPHNAFTVELMQERPDALVVNLPDPRSWIHARLAANVAHREDLLREHATLSSIRATALLPVMTKDGLYSVISLGPRISELPFSREDQQVLMSIIWQTAFAIENVLLFERERQKEEQFRQSQKMEAVGRLAGGIAHDFNNLLTAINGYSDLTLRQLEAGSPLRHKVEEIKKAGERAAGLTRQLLAFSRKQVLQPKVLNLNSIIADMDKMLRRLISEDVDFLTVLDADLGQVEADPGQVEQVLMNLAVNARDAMPKGGKLTIETANVYLDEAYARGHATVRPGQYVMLAVSDTGHGIDAVTRSRIFEPFFTTKGVGKGTGLGLSTVYGIVKQSGGNVWVYSEVERGTSFKIYLPRVEQPAQKFERNLNANADLPRGTETVLLVEDEETVRRMSREILQMSGYGVLEAHHGGRALEISAHHKGPIHLMVTDVVMPQMSGRELAEELFDSRPDMKVLYMSGYTDDAIMHHGVLDEGMAFLEKPFAPLTLARRVREMLDAQPA